MNLINKNMIVLGAGSSGRAAAALALAQGARVAVHDTAGQITGLPEGVTSVPGASVETGQQSHCDLLVLSPGIDGESDFVKSYQKNAGEMVGEVEFGYRYFKGKIVAITGTNGKTTTTELVDRILNHHGISCLPCGNYGKAFSAVALMENPPEAVALEVSSFQLETIKEFHPDVAIWLNFSADHMDRYPTIEAYKAAKLRIFENLTDENHVILRAGEDVGKLRAPVITFSTEEEADYSLHDGWICQGGEQKINLSETRLRGLHNAENAMAAYAACATLGVSASGANQALRGFAPPLHRCELVRTLDGVEYINDSKATNLHALDSALRSQCRPIVLIAGGKQKGLDYSEVLPRLQATTKGIVVFGEIGQQLADTFNPLSTAEKPVPTNLVSSLEDAIQVAKSMAEHGDTILFSPGTSSFDMFSGYEERGDYFRRIVKKLK
ncbi:MAG: UDP-N-acetylmuramoyl-L-alanine--D-glutamate ligase [Verrucomicrobiae bacterium]|nr:UDP-N-acetylmuramoyl-L-alanine--D-glutamate ligase [Verrucomicrobiae bacterium]NNJ86315.1 UDP-N-acetylmuramoyl-L-alanine--D-glutamate ligase [Akkermansiaceae bacterium]